MMEFEDPTFELQHLPPFANEYNKQLDRQNKEKEQRIAALTKELSELTDRTARMKDHLKNVKIEYQNTQQLNISRHKEVETERHLKQLADREYGKSRVEIDKLKKEINELKERMNVIQNNMFRAKEKLDTYQEQMEMDANALELWAAAQKQKEDDNLALQKYQRADEARIKELTLQIEKLTKEVKNKQNQLDAEVTETRAAQIELDKTGEEFKNLHRERQELLLQWEESIKAAERREQLIKQAEETLQAILKEQAAKRVIINDKRKFLDGETENNKELEHKIAAADRTLTKLRTEYGIAQSSIVEYEDELETVKNTLSKSVANLESKKSEITILQEEIEAKKKRIEKQKSTLEKTKYNLEVHYQQTNDLDKRAKQLDMYYREKEQKLKQAEKMQTDLKQKTFKEAQELHKLIQMEQNLLSELNGARAADKNLQAKINKLDTESLKQQELVYNQEYQLQQLERKISRAQGERSNEEKQVLTAKIKELTAQLEKQNEEHILLTNQHKKIEDDVRAIKRKLVSTTAEKQQLMTRINELTLENESALRALKAISKKKEELLVAENFVRLDVKRLRDYLYMRADEVVGLENRKIQLKLSMEERKQEINVHKDVLRAQLRTAEEERHERAKELASKINRIEKMKKKYQLLAFQLSPEGEEEHTQAYYIIRAAQQKEELLKEKEAITAEINKCETEVRKLEVSLVQLNVLNQRLHQQKTRGQMTEGEFEESNRLQVREAEVKERHRKKLHKAQDLQSEVNSLKDSLEQSSEEKSELDAEIDSTNAQITQLEKELQEQQNKLQRALNLLRKCNKSLKMKFHISDREQSIIEQDVSLQFLKKKNEYALFSLAQLVQLYPQLREDLETELAEANLQLRSRPPSAGSLDSLPHSPPTSHPGTPSRGTPRNSVSPKSVSINNLFQPKLSPRNKLQPPSRAGSATRLMSASQSPRNSSSLPSIPKPVNSAFSPPSSKPSTPTRPSSNISRSGSSRMQSAKSVTPTTIQLSF